MKSKKRVRFSIEGDLAPDELSDVCCLLAVFFRHMIKYAEEGKITANNRILRFDAKEIKEWGITTDTARLADIVMTFDVSIGKRAASRIITYTSDSNDYLDVGVEPPGSWGVDWLASGKTVNEFEAEQVGKHD